MNSNTLPHTQVSFLHHKEELRTMYSNLPPETVECIDNVVTDTLESLGDQGFRVSFADPIEDLKLAILKYIFETETIIDNKSISQIIPLINVNCGNA